jgi:hypothetical protein
MPAEKPGGMFCFPIRWVEPHVHPAWQQSLPQHQKSLKTVKLPLFCSTPSTSSSHAKVLGPQVNPVGPAGLPSGPPTTVNETCDVGDYSSEYVSELEPQLTSTAMHAVKHKGMYRPVRVLCYL